MRVLLLAALLGALGLLGPRLAAAHADAADERRVFTYFYYWYEPPSDDPLNIIKQLEMTSHFPKGNEGNWRSVAWFKQQLLDMQLAGIDVALAVYWGSEVYADAYWSTAGLRQLARAMDDLDDDGLRHPKIGLFLDTYILQGANLTEPTQVAWLASQIRAFYQHIPERHRALQDGRPIIWLYLSAFANDFNQETFQQLDALLSHDLGAPPFWVAEESWLATTWTDYDGTRYADPDQPMAFDGLYRWGAASSGALFVDAPIPVASVGPGYDDTNISNRGDERSDRPRESGCFYARNWRAAQTAGARWVVVETWNELYEASGVAETAEWGREYIYATTSHATRFKRNEPIELPAECPDDPVLAASAAPQAVGEVSGAEAPDEEALATEAEDLEHEAAASSEEPGEPDIPADQASPSAGSGQALNLDPDHGACGNRLLFRPRLTSLGLCP